MATHHAKTISNGGGNRWCRNKSRKRSTQVTVIVVVAVVDALVTTVFVGGVAAMDGIAPAWCLWLCLLDASVSSQ
jgi:hypothetical protein